MTRSPSSLTTALLAFLVLLLTISLSDSQWACPSGWYLYTDDGTEGHNSCLLLVKTAISWAAANSTCVQGTHLLTIAATTYPSGITSFLNVTWGQSDFHIGCSQLYAQPARNVGWQWVDGTSNASLEQNSTYNAVGYGMWRVSTGEPKYVNCRSSCF